MDMRYYFRNGDKVRIIKGPCLGQMAEVETRTAMLRMGDRWITCAGYH